jgi:hypothetical protein
MMKRASLRAERGAFSGTTADGAAVTISSWAWDRYLVVIAKSHWDQGVIVCCRDCGGVAAAWQAASAWLPANNQPLSPAMRQLRAWGLVLQRVVYNHASDQVTAQMVGALLSAEVRGADPSVGLYDSQTGEISGG